MNKITQEKFNEIERKTLGYLIKINEDLNNSIENLRKTDRKLLKSELCLAFIGADTFSRFYEIVLKGTDSKENEKRFCSWFNNFVFTNKNEIYKKYKKEINCNSFIAWKLRNSLLHFYGLPDFPDKAVEFFHFPRKELEKLKKRLKKNKGINLCPVDPYYLIRAIFRGLILQVKSLEDMIEKNPSQYINRMLKCYEITQRECSETVDLTKIKIS